MISSVKQYIVSRFLKNRYLKNCFHRDYILFDSFSCFGGESVEILAARIRVVSHTIEKAFSLSDCRDDFGREKVMNLISLLDTYTRQGGHDLDAVNLAESVIYVYSLHRLNKGLDVSFIPKRLMERPVNFVECGARSVCKTDFSGFKGIAYGRHSVRNFSERPVAETDIMSAVRIAQTAPSACNRQATRVYACIDSKKIAEIKEAHGGIRSFGKPGVIFAITQDLSMYLNEYERNTWLVDGGIFCMNLLYSLYSVGIGCCPVIWGGMEDEDKRMEHLLGIPKNERIVVLVVGGYLPESGCKTPYSTKRPVKDVLRLVK